MRDPRGTFMLAAAGCGTSPNQARARARGEAIERIAALMALQADRHASGTAAELRAGGYTPLALEPWSAADHGGVTPDTDRMWCEGTELRAGRPVLIPSELVHLRSGDARTLVPLDGSGLCAHRTRTRAILHGLCEVLERDALTLAWRVPGWPVLQLPEQRVSRSLRAAARGLGVRPHWFDLSSDGAARVVGVVLCDAAGGHATVGSAAGLRLSAQLVEHALAEALLLQWTARCSGEARRALAQRAEWWAQPRSSLEHVLRGFHSRSVLSWFLWQARRPAAQLRRAASSLPELVERTTRAFDAAVFVETTPRGFKDLGWTAGRVLVPGALTRHAPDGHPRIVAALGAGGTAGRALNPRPAPYG